MTFILIGLAAYALPVGLAGMGLVLVFSRDVRVGLKWLWLLLFMLGLVTVLQLQHGLWAPLVARLNLSSPGGLLGHLLADRLLVRLMGRVGTGILAWALLLTSLIFLFEFRPVAFGQRAAVLGAAIKARAGALLDERRDRKAQIEKEERDVARKRRRLEKTLKQQERASGPKKEAPTLARTVEDIPPSPAETPAPRTAVAPAPDKPRPTLASLKRKKEPAPAPEPESVPVPDPGDGPQPPTTPCPPWTCSPRWSRGT